jgi:glutathione synthase/RimK-type ligase-like ATP-grasp enzyme
VKKLTILLDYKGRFETKYTAIPYRSGMDKEYLKQCFKNLNIEVGFITFNQLNFRDSSLKDRIFLYSSSEDKEGYYKLYIEDIIMGLKQSGAIVIPEYKFLKAHHNKVFMEILFSLAFKDSLQNLQSEYFGTIESLVKVPEYFPEGEYVIKPAEGSMSKGISSAKGFRDILKKAKKVSRTSSFWNELKEIIRKGKYKGYIADSKFRRKFIVQKKVPGLSGDWKILIYGNKFYILKRTNRKNDFRASGGGRLSYTADIPAGILDFSEKIYKTLNVPNLSMDIGFNGNKFYLFEFQCLYFGTYTMEKSDSYYIRENNGWVTIKGKSILEEEYARSISEYISRGFVN